MSIDTYPLTWPEGWPRSPEQIRSRFSKKKSSGWGTNPITINHAVGFLLEELRRMGVPDYDVIISTNLRLRMDGLPISNQRQPDDCGVSVWWRDYGKQQVIALDKYDRIADNIYAVAKTIEALRGIERWGSGEILERTFTGFAALPHADNVENWRDVLQMGNDQNDSDEVLLARAERHYKILAKDAHPDKKGGSDQAMQKINWAREQARQELG